MLTDTDKGKERKWSNSRKVERECEEGRKEGKKWEGRQEGMKELRQEGMKEGWKVHSNESIKIKLICVSVGATKGLQQR